MPLEGAQHDLRLVNGHSECQELTAIVTPDVMPVQTGKLLLLCLLRSNAQSGLAQSQVI